MQRIAVSVLAAALVGIVGTSAASAQTYPYGTSTTPYAGSGGAFPTNGFTSSYSSYGYNAYPGYGSSGVYGSYNTAQYGQPYNSGYNYGQPSSYGYSTPGYGYTGSYNSYPSTYNGYSSSYNNYPTNYGTQSYYGGTYPGSTSTPYGGPPGTYGMGSGVYGYNGTPPNPYPSNTYGYPPNYNSTPPGAYNYGAPGQPPGYSANVGYSQTPGATGTTSNGTNYVLGQYYYGTGVSSTPYTGQQNFQITPYNQGALGQYLTGYNVPMQGGTPMPMFQQPTSGY
jgi:hypothetical protein